MNRRQILASTGAVASLGLCAGIVAGAPGCTPAPAAELIGADLAFAIERHRIALADMEASGRVQEACESAMMMLETPNTRSAFAAADDAFTLDCEREAAAHNRVIAVPIVTLADMRAKASYLASVRRHMIHDGGTMAALLASMGGTHDGLSITPAKRDPLAEIVSAYNAANDELNATDIHDDELGAYCEAHLNPLRTRMMEEALVPTTMAGALAALRLADHSMGQGDIDLGEPLIAAVRQFFDGRA